MIKQIQLRGISRTPSDRMTQDGGLAECLNLQLDHGELVPMPKPDEITADVIKEEDLPEYSGSAYILLFIHNGTYYRNYIVWRSTAILDPQHGAYMRYALVATVNGESSEIKTWNVSGSNQPAPPDVASVGNTLIVTFNSEMMYFLFKDGEYKFIYNGHLPAVPIRFYMEKDDADRTPDLSGVGHLPSDIDTETVDFLLNETKGTKLGENDWGKAGNSYKVNVPEQLAVIEKINDEVARQVAGANSAGKCVFPVVLRYAVRLYDGNLYACSTPILMGAELEDNLGVKLISVRTGRTIDIPQPSGQTLTRTYYEVGAAVKTPSRYSIVVDFSNCDFTGDIWDEIVEGVELYVSTPLVPYVDLDSIQLSEHDEGEPQSGGYCEWYTAEAVIDPVHQGQKKEEILLAHQTTFLAKRWSVKELREIVEADDPVELTDINFSGDWLATQPVMKESYNSVHTTIGDGISSYNNRLLLEGAKQVVSPGYQFHPSTDVKYDPGRANEYRIELKWHVSIDGEGKIVNGRNVSGGTEFRREYVDVMLDAYPVAILTYPDARASSVDIKFTYPEGYQMQASVYRTFATKQFTEIDAAYVYFGFGVDIFTAMESGDPITEEEWNALEEDPVALLPDQLLMSESSNPFIFPAEGVVDFSGSAIVGTGMATKALSEGQFGQFPLYVFTSTGIWSLTLNAEGGFVAKHPVTRDVALKGTIVPIDQAIVFTTKKGVMLLSGSDVATISPDMSGKHYILDNEVATLLSNGGLSGFITAAQNPESFQEFMETAAPVYDYTGERLIFGSPTYGRYMYVYRLNTGTWHKMTLIEGEGSSIEGEGSSIEGEGSSVEMTLIEGEGPSVDIYSVNRAINSYPDAIMSVTAGNETKVFNFSTVLDSDGTGGNAMENGLVVTRAMDFDERDIRKTLRDLRIRGAYHRGHAKYILLGSFDGFTWHRLRSLRGASFKRFRIAIVTTLAASERLSWIEVDYQTRFANRLR